MVPISIAVSSPSPEMWTLGLWETKFHLDVNMWLMAIWPGCFPLSLKSNYIFFLSSCASGWAEDPWSNSRPHNVREIPSHHKAAWVSPKTSLPRMACMPTKKDAQLNVQPWEIALMKRNALTENIKLDAVVVTVTLAEEEQCWRALENDVHMMALQVNNRLPDNRRRGTWSYNHTANVKNPPCSLWNSF